jgi:hypothetical protein
MQPHVARWEVAIEEGAESSVNDLLTAFGEAENRLREVSLKLAFGDKDAQGSQIQRTGEEVGELMGLSSKRGVMLLKRAMQAVPLVVDRDPVEVLETLCFP